MLLPIAGLLSIAGCGGGANGASDSRLPPLQTASYHLSGTITPAAQSVVDSDSNDPSASVVSNNTPATAQLLPDRVTLGGYLSFKATGNVADRFGTIPDPEDWYRVALSAGQLVVLTIADHDGILNHTNNPDFDLYLVDPATGVDVQTAEEEGRQEILAVLQSGVYQLLVKAHRGASNYQLQIVPAPTVAAGDLSFTPVAPQGAAPGVGRHPGRPAGLPPDDPYFSQQWNLQMLNLPQAWQQTTGSSDVVIALLDSGVATGHPDLAGRLCTPVEGCAGYDFVSDPANGDDGDGIDADPADPGSVGPANLIPYHGTHVAGIVGAAGNNGIGIAGVDWAARIMPVRVFGKGERSAHDIIQGVRYAAGLPNDSGTVPRRPARIISLSLGGGGYVPAEQALFRQLHDAGIFVVAAAGNDASPLPVYPAAYDGVISVSAVDPDKRRPVYANSGFGIDLVAPGGDAPHGRNSAIGILGPEVNHQTLPLTYVYSQTIGTSMAVPQVAGIISLMLAVNPDLTPAQFDVLLAGGRLTEDPGGDGAVVRNDNFGYGLIDARKAVQAARDLAVGGSSLPPALAPSATLLNFGTAKTGLPLALANVGGGRLQVKEVRHAIPWLKTVSRLDQKEADNLVGTYQLQIDRTGLADGLYSGTLSIVTDEPATRTVTLVMQVGAVAAANVGAQTVVLRDAETNNVVQSVGARVNPQSGEYDFDFSNVPAGRYSVCASSDLDHDGQYCDAGESCGCFSREGEESVKVIDHDVTGIDFFSQYGLGDGL